MALERPPKHLSLNPEMIKAYRPPEGGVARWHVVTSGRQENFVTIAARYFVPVEKVIELNFPGSVEGGRVIPEIVNWYLHHHRDFGCPETHDRLNRIFKGGERIAIPRTTGAGPQLPTLAETRKWFVEKVLPKRTAARGYSVNRIWTSPRGWISGNVEDANGLCGDATLFVAEEFHRQYRDYRTSDGHIVGMVLWEGSSARNNPLELNHIANVMLPQNKVRKETYTYDSSAQQVRPAGAAVQYDTASLLNLWVLDLYYKMPPHSLGHWWTERDFGRGGRITIGLQHDFAE